MSNGYSLLRYLGNERALARSGESHDKNACSSNAMLMRSKTMSLAVIHWLAGALQAFSVLRHSQWDCETEPVFLRHSQKFRFVMSCLSGRASLTQIHDGVVIGLFFLGSF
jgi:hypothetical protein